VRLGADGHPGHAQHDRDLLIGELLVVAQHEHGALFGRQAGERPPHARVPLVGPGQAGVVVATLGRLADEHLAAQPPPAADVQAGHGGADVRLGIGAMAHPRPGDTQPRQRLLGQVRGVVRIARQHVAVAQQGGSAAAHEPLELVVTLAGHRSPPLP
jgi:hypothetical protein